MPRQKINRIGAIAPFVMSLSAFILALAGGTYPRFARPIGGGKGSMGLGRQIGCTSLWRKRNAEQQGACKSKDQQRISFDIVADDTWCD
jgi:hypothetical protein